MSVFPVPNTWPYAIVDASHHNGDINPETLLSKEVHALIFKIGQGSIQDHKFRQNFAIFRGKIARAGYFFFEPCTDAVVQAQLLASSLAPDRGEIRAFVDIEQNGDSTGRLNTKGLPYAPFSPVQYFDMLFTFIETSDKLMGYKIGLYSRAGFWNSNIPAGMFSRKLGKRLDINGRIKWLANYFDYRGVTAATRPAVPNDWAGQWDIWQFSADKPPNYMGREYGFSGSTSIDLNVTRAKSASEFQQIFGVYPRQVYEVPVNEIFPRLAKTTCSVAIRSDAGETYVKYGWADSGSVWTVYGRKLDTLKRPWLILTPVGDQRPKYFAEWLTVKA